MATRLYSATEGRKFSGDTTLIVESCPTCGITYAIPEGLYQNASKYNQAAYPSNYRKVCCPAGHEWHYTGRNEEQELQRKLANERDRSGRLAADLDQTEARRVAQKAATTRARRRHAAGVCPACKRTFQNVQRHMDSQHPDYDPAKGHHEGS